MAIVLIVLLILSLGIIAALAFMYFRRRTQSFIQRWKKITDEI
jgi:hypothetical protein